MQIGYFDYYLIGINAIGFVLFIINEMLYRYTDEAQIDALVTIASILGGSAGIILSMIILGTKAEKANMMSRVFVSCVFVVWVVIVLVTKGHIKNEITLNFTDFFSRNKFLIIYLLVINVITLIVFALDKIAAIEGKMRIRIVTLLGLAFLGGSIGGLIAMYVFRHKTNKDYFTVGVPMILIMQLVVIFYLMNGKLN